MSILQSLRTYHLKKKLDKFKPYAVLVAGILLMLCTVPIVYYTTKNGNIVTKMPSESASNSVENSANIIVLKPKDSSDHLLDRTESPTSSVISGSNDITESRNISEQASEYSAKEFSQQLFESNMSDDLESSDSLDNSNFKDESESDTKDLPEEKSIDDFDVNSMGVVVYDGRIYYQDLSMDYNETDIEQLEKMLDDNLGSTIYKNNEWWEGKTQNEVLSESFVSSYDGEIYSIKRKKVEEEIAVKISDENHEMIIFLKS